MRVPDRYNQPSQPVLVEVKDAGSRVDVGRAAGLGGGVVVVAAAAAGLWRVRRRRV